ncbi:MAG TPA: glycosyltransferase family 4 protein [Dongiaceae bacterium]|jgi:glycosyltransferase involved in cell wall biosynthesis|nr:glycosyltransferase family 4 protein [Dongiaceae bacterium]
MVAKGRRTILIAASPSWRFGWGIYAINMALHWHGDPDLAPLTALPFDPPELLDLPGLDPAWRERLVPFAAASLAFQKTLKNVPGPVLDVSCPMLHPLYDQMHVAPLPGGNLAFGRPTIGMVFSMDTAIASAARERAKRFPLIVAGCRWNQQVLQDAGIGPVALVIQGIEPTLFHPGPRGGRFGGRFAIFSGGKLEYRKGQDLVMRAFRDFHRRHSEAQLVTAWHSPWPGLSQSLAGEDSPAPPQQPGGAIDVLGWANSFGLPPDAIVDLGTVPQPKMPALLREMDVALFPNRCECGTNLVAMEAMACGLPTILSANTGHLDLMTSDNSYGLTRQKPVDPGRAGVGGSEGWGESDCEEILAQLEAVYTDRAEAARRGGHAAATLAQLPWQRQVQALKATILPCLD